MAVFSELAGKVTEHRLVDSDLLIIMPAYKSVENVEKHLSLLARQTFRKFNVIVVAGVGFGEARLESFLRRRRLGFGVVVALENERRGCAGAFFAGQRYALEKGYQYIIMTDDDCMPVDRRLVEGLYRKRKVGYVACTRHLVEGKHRKVVRDFGVAQYCLLSREILEKHGLHYLPLFSGADDGEYAERISGERKIRIGNYIEHPYIAGMRLFSVFDRSWLFFMQALIIMRSPASVAYNLAQLSVMLPVCLLFLPPYGSKLFFTLTRLLLTHTYGKAADEALKTGFWQWVEPHGSGSGAGCVIDESEESYIDLPAAKKVAGAFLLAAACFRKDAYIEDCQSLFRGLLVAAAAKRCRVRTDRGALLLSDNHNAALHAARLVALPAVSLLYLLLMVFAFLPIKVAMQPRTEGYGL